MKTFEIETNLTVVLSRKWRIEAEDSAAALEKFEADQDNAVFLSEKSVDLIGDETIVNVKETLVDVKEITG